MSLPTEHRRSCHHSPSAGVGHIATTTAAIIIIIIIIIIVVVVVVVVNIRGREAGALRSITLSRVVNAEVRVCVCVSVCVCVCLCVCVCPHVSVPVCAR